MRDPARRALVIASQTGRLTGCHNDADLIGELLRDNGFDVRPVRAAAATRAGILGAYEELIEASGPGDAAVVYYAGHGSRLSAGDGGTPRELRFILPTDIDATDATDFRGILAEELSVLQWRLTARTDNVTTILDCCFAARMSRTGPDDGPDGLRPRARDRDWPTGAVLDRWAAAGEDFRRLRSAHPGADWSDANPRAVRMVACSSHQRAYEGYSAEHGRQQGLFTAALVAILRADPRCTWLSAGARARHRVQGQQASQRPEAEGPAERIVFTLDVHREGPAHPVSADASTGRAWLDGARVHGVLPGDVFLLADAGTVPDEKTARAVRVTRLAGDAALLAAIDGAPIPAGTTAHRAPGGTGDALRALGRVRVGSTDGSPTGPVVAALADLPGVHAHDAATPGGGMADEIAAVTVTDGRFLLSDATGPLYVTAQPVDRAGIRRLQGHVTQLATSVRLRDLAPDAGDLSAPVGLVVAGHAGRVTDGAVLHRGEHLRVGVTQLAGGHGHVYANVLDLGVAGRISVLNEAEPAGIELAPGEHRPVREDPGGHQQGVELHWPEGVPAGTARSETIVAVFSDTPQDLRGLTQLGITTTRRPSVTEELARLLSTGNRIARPLGRHGHGTRFAVRRVTFLLCPGGSSCLCRPALSSPMSRDRP